MTDNIAQLTAALADRYRIERELGQGGMATVYLAQDLRHDRKVAIKVLRPELAAVIGAERFLSEIKTTANLQHPHILALFDSGAADSFLFYVMPFIEGESLRDRLNREKQLPVSDAIRIATEIASALDYAHRHNVIHRDIKPENIMLHDGQALVADFGIALAASKAGGSRITETGMSLGTPTYMSPEQAMGEREITVRSDVYALGCVLYELLAGEPPFTGPTAQAILARVMTEEPRSLTLQRKTIPPYVAAAVNGALAKLPADRFATVHEFSDALSGRSAVLPVGVAATGAKRTGPQLFRAAVPWAIAAALAMVAFIRIARRPSANAAAVVVSSVLPPDGQEFSEAESFGALSPDGKRFAFVSLGPQGERQLWIRRLDTLNAQAVPGAVGARAPFWSPDGSAVAFFTGDTLHTIETSGGAHVLCLAPNASSGSWGPRDLIVVAARGGIFKGNASGVGCALAIKADSSLRGDALAPQHPTILPDGQHVLFSRFSNAGSSAIVLGDLRTGSMRTLLDQADDPQFVAPDVLVFGRLSGDGRLWGQRFDVGRLELKGPAMPLSGVVRTGAAVFAYTASARSLLYLPGTFDLGELITDRAGRVVDTVSVRGTWTFQWARAHPWLADAGDGPTLVIHDLTRRISTPAPASRALWPAWSPDDTAIAYLGCTDKCGLQLYHLADERAVPLVISPPATEGTYFAPTSWTSDGKRLVVTRGTEILCGHCEIWMLNFADKEVKVLVSGAFDAGDGNVSPDGRWLAYRSDETGSAEVWVRPFLRPGRSVRVSTGGGRQPRWRRDGRELLFESPDGYVMAAVVTSGSEFASAAPQALFVMPGWTRQMFFDKWATSFDVSPDGQRFAVRRSMTSHEAVLVYDWRSLMK